MKKIDLFFISGSQKKSKDIENKLKKLKYLEKKGKKIHSSTLLTHYFILSKHFNLRNYYSYKDSINLFEAPLIYHLPYGKDSETGVELELLRWKDKVPILMRSYDAHSAMKTSLEYMLKYHDFVITYLKERVNDKNIVFAHLCYDNHLVKKFDKMDKKKLACMILRNRKGGEYRISSSKFKEKGLSLKKNYDSRKRFINSNFVDIYGKGYSKNVKNFKGPILPFDQKYFVLNAYKYNVVLENALVDSYISEKILDSFLTLTVPIYQGSPRIKSYVPEELMIDLNEFNENSGLESFLNKHNYKFVANKILAKRDDIFNLFSTKENFTKIAYSWYNQNFDKEVYLDEDFYLKTENDFSKLRYVSSKKLFSLVFRFLFKRFFI